MNKNLTFSYILTFLLALSPVNAATGLFGGLGSNSLFQSMKNLLEMIFMIGDMNRNEFVLFGRIALFVVVFILVYTVIGPLLSRMAGSNNDLFGKSSKSNSAIIISLIIAWTSSILLPANVVINFYETSTIIFTVILFGAPAFGLYYVKSEFIDETFEPGTQANILVKTIFYLFILIFLSGILGSFTSSSSYTSEIGRDTVTTISNLVGLLNIFAFIMFVGHLLWFILAAIGFIGIEYSALMGSFDKDIETTEEDAKETVEDLTEIANATDDPEIKNVAETVANEVQNVDEILNEVKEAVQEEEKAETVREMEEKETKITNSMAGLNKQRERLKKISAAARQKIQTIKIKKKFQPISIVDKVKDKVSPAKDETGQVALNKAIASLDKTLDKKVGEIEKRAEKLAKKNEGVLTRFAKRMSEIKESRDSLLNSLFKMREHLKDLKVLAEDDKNTKFKALNSELDVNYNKYKKAYSIKNPIEGEYNLLHTQLDKVTKIIGRYKQTRTPDAIATVGKDWVALIGKKDRGMGGDTVLTLINKIQSKLRK